MRNVSFVVTHHTEYRTPDDLRFPVSGPGNHQCICCVVVIVETFMCIGCPMFINGNSQILPGVDSQNTEISTFKG